MPSLMPASISSHSSTWLPNMMIMRSPRFTPWPRSQLATWFERADDSAKLRRVAEPSCSTITSAGFRPVAGSAAMASNQSSPKLNSAGRGHSKVLLAWPSSWRRASSRSRAARKSSVTVIGHLSPWNATSSVIHVTVQYTRTSKGLEEREGSMPVQPRRRDNGQPTERRRVVPTPPVQARSREAPRRLFRTRT